MKSASYVVQISLVHHITGMVRPQGQPGLWAKIFGLGLVVVSGVGLTIFFCPRPQFSLDSL